MKKKVTEPSFNVEYVKSKKKDEFVKEFKDVYPNVDLGAIHDKLTSK